MKTVFAIFIIFSLVACSPSESAIQTAVAQTQAALPTSTLMPTATVVPITELDIESILIIEGDLPPGFEAAQIRSTFFGLSMFFNFENEPTRGRI